MAGSGVLADVLLEALDVEADFPGIRDEIPLAEPVLVGEQLLVHLPERALRARRLRGLSRELGVWMHVGERQMAPHVPDLIAEGREQLADHRLRLPAVRALEVAVFEQRDRRIVRPAHVVALVVDRLGEVDDRLRSAEERAEPHRRRQQCKRAEDEPGRERRAEPGGEHAELRLFELLPRERTIRDQQRDREADSRDRAAAQDRAPADRRA